MANETQAPETPAPVAAETHPAYASRSALVTTGIACTLLSFSASLLFFHFFPQTQIVQQPAPQIVQQPAQPAQPIKMPFVVLDMVQMGAEITRIANSGGDPQGAFDAVGKYVADLAEQGYIVFDARNIIHAPESFKIKPSKILPGASDKPVVGSGYVPPNLLLGVSPEGLKALEETLNDNMSNQRP